MEHFEKLGAFYLGRPYDIESGQPESGYLLYDSKDLVTHGVCVGMTGSGKTGLCLALLEEAAMDSIPAIIIDPKGDMANLLLTFPDLNPSDFRPWINEEDAKRKDLSPDAYAQAQADLWKNGLAEWGQDGERIRQMRDKVEFGIYTPGSTAGIPVSILGSLQLPPPAILADAELLQDQITGMATSLLGLLGLSADPVRSREHILISTILQQAWSAGRSLDLAALIGLIQNPPVKKIGIMEIDAFFPAKDRQELALQFNNLLASPSFASWLEGEALDINRILYTPTGKPRVAIFSIAHLGDAERMFFVSLILNQILSWIRTQSGTTSLRAILYMDEIYGFFPPVENPPSKKPLLTLLKQARAYGLGILLTTQNPVDLDYKGLANTGTWFIGRLQTERDKMRVLEGLEGVSAAQGTGFDRATMSRILSGLKSRVFLMHNVHDDGPTVFETRWCMSYLRGPLTRDQLSRLRPTTDDRTATTPPPASIQEPAAAAAVPPPVTANEAAAPTEKQQPTVPAGVRQFFIPLRRPAGPSGVIYQPAVIGFAQVGFRDRAGGFQETRDVLCTCPIQDSAFAVDWQNAEMLEMEPTDLESQGVDGALYDELPAPAAIAANYKAWQKDFSDWLYQTQSLEIFNCPKLKARSKPGENEMDFRLRLQQQAREARDDNAEKLRQKYGSRIATLTERIRKSEQAVEREKEQAKQQKMQTAISFGATILSSFVGKKAISASSLSRATTTAKGITRSLQQQGDVDRSKETVEAYKAQLQELEDEFRAEMDKLDSQTDPSALQIEPLIIRPTKTNILVKAVGLVWIP
jgi:hypothetical protein